MVNNRPFLVEKTIEDATVGSGEVVKITTRKLIKGKWFTRVRKEKTRKE